MTDKLTLAQKIAQASNAVGALATDKLNTQGNYRYISADKILERAGNALADVGVAVVPGITHVEVNTGTTSGNKPRFDVTVYMKMLVTDGETDIETSWLGMGSDYSVPDKATYKAITSGHKYFLAKLLNVGVGNEDGEHDPAQEPAEAPAIPTNGKPAAKPVAKPAPKTPQKATTAQNGDKAQDNPFLDESSDSEALTPATANGNAPSQAELTIIGDWSTPADAHAWAVEHGHCENAHHAQKRFANVVREQFDNKLSKQNMAAVMLAFLRACTKAEKQTA